MCEDGKGAAPACAWGGAWCVWEKGWLLTPRLSGIITPGTCREGPDLPPGWTEAVASLTTVYFSCVELCGRFASGLYFLSGALFIHASAVLYVRNTARNSCVC